MWCSNIILVCCLLNLRLVESNDTEHVIEIAADDSTPPRVFLFIFGGLAVAGILRTIIKTFNIPIPFRVFVLFVGVIIGVLAKASELVEGYTRIIHFPPRYMLMACLPVLMFKTAFCIDAHTFLRSWGQIFFLAIPGMLLNTVFTGLIMMKLLEHEWTIAMGLLFGTICSSIYPLEIIELLQQIGQAKHLSILLEGEGMIGDGTVIIMFEVLLGVIEGHISEWYQIVLVFSRFVIGGVILGYVCGKLMGWIMTALYSDVVNLLVFTIGFSFLTYYIAAELLSVSGVIAVVVLGIMISMEKTSLSTEVEAFLMYFWKTLAYAVNAIVFLLAGVIIAEKLSSNVKLQDYALVIITYFIVFVGRFIEYIVLAPIVSRIGYGLTFRNMTIAVCSGLRGPVPFCLALKVYHHTILSSIGQDLLVHIAGLVALTLLINATFMPLLLRLLGLSELSVTKKVNMNFCMRHLQNRRDRTISILKMNRFLADANWPLVNTETVLKHPYKIKYNENEEEEENYLGYRITTCPDCLRDIPHEPTYKEMSEMIREARMRIIKAKKTSYARQYENGMLSKDGIRVLTQAIETAMDTPAALIELDGLHKFFKRKGFLHSFRRKLLSLFFKKDENHLKQPRRFWRKLCYRIVMHPAFDFFIYSVILLNVIPISLEISMWPPSGTPLSLALKMANTIFFLIYLAEFFLKIYGYSWIYIFHHGVKTYCQSYWNLFDFFVLCVCAIDLTLDYIDLFSTSYNKVDSTFSKVTVVTKLVRVIRLLRLLKLCKAWYPKLIQYCDSKIDKHLAFAYEVGKGFVSGEEEVSDMLIHMIDNKAVREDCRLRMETDRLAITKELGLVQKDRPWIAITVKTKQAVRTTLNSMAEALGELKVSGWVDDVEYGKLMESLDERIKYARTRIKSVQPSPPKEMFKDVPWMADDDQIAEFLYENVVTKIFDQGEVVCAEGEMSDGVYIIVTGLFKLQYVPKKETLDSLAENGSLPIIDYISSTRFDEKVEDYIVSGNCIGELSTLTGRPYNCTITADTASQAYILTHDIIKKAIQRSPDAVNGLESKMWKCISIRMATSILMDTPTYQSSTQDKIHYHLERAFVPNLSRYKIFGVNDMMEDIILIEGVVFDYNTRDCYTAPCYIPRTVQKIVLPKSSHMNVDSKIEAKLLIIPAQDVDEFDIMEKEEEISEMISTASVKCLQHVIQGRMSKRMKRRRKRQGAFGIGQRRVKYGESRISSATPSMYYSRSGMTNASSFESELRHISINDMTHVAYIINERNRRRSSRSSSRRSSNQKKNFMKEVSDLESAQNKKLRDEIKQIQSHQIDVEKEHNKNEQFKNLAERVAVTESKLSSDSKQTNALLNQDVNMHQDSEDLQKRHAEEPTDKTSEENKTQSLKATTRTPELPTPPRYPRLARMSVANKLPYAFPSLEDFNPFGDVFPRLHRFSSQSPKQPSIQSENPDKEKLSYMNKDNDYVSQDPMQSYILKKDTTLTDEEITYSADDEGSLEGRHNQQKQWKWSGEFKILKGHQRSKAEEFSQQPENLSTDTVSYSKENEKGIAKQKVGNQNESSEAFSVTKESNVDEITRRKESSQKKIHNGSMSNTNNQQDQRSLSNKRFEELELIEKSLRKTTKEESPLDFFNPSPTELVQGYLNIPDNGSSSENNFSSQKQHQLPGKEKRSVENEVEKEGITVENSDEQLIVSLLPSRDSAGFVVIDKGSDFERSQRRSDTISEIEEYFTSRRPRLSTNATVSVEDVKKTKNRNRKDKVNVPSVSNKQKDYFYQSKDIKNDNVNKDTSTIQNNTGSISEKPESCKRQSFEDYFKMLKPEDLIPQQSEREKAQDPPLDMFESE